jgi:COMPASS component SWD2
VHVQGAFSSFPIVDRTLNFTPEWSALKFSNDGNNLLVVTKSEYLYIVDAFEGTIKHTLTGHTNKTGLDISANFTPDFWSVQTGQKVPALQAHNEPCTAVLFNPRYMMLASADSALVSCKCIY